MTTTCTRTKLADAAAEAIACSFHNLPAGHVPTYHEKEQTSGGYAAESWTTNYIAIHPHEIDHEHADQLPPFVAAILWNVRPYASNDARRTPTVSVAAFITPTGGRLARTMTTETAAAIEAETAELLEGFSPRAR